MARPDSGPISVNLSPELRRGLAREARRRGLPLSTTLRTLVVERIEELAQDAELSRAEAWQRAQAWATWDRVRAGDRQEIGRAELMEVFDRPPRARRK